MRIINRYLQEITSKDYEDERFNELKKKRYLSNGYYWVYLGNSNYEEVPWHLMVWNKHNPNKRVKFGDGNLIHHKDGNKLNNAPSNLFRVTKSDHDRNHLLAKRKKYKDKFSKETSSLGGKNSIKRHPELMKNLKWNHKK